MKWNKYALKTKSDAVDLVSGIFMESGIDSLEIIEEDEGGDAQIVFYLEEASDSDFLDGLIDKIEELRDFADVGEATLSVSITEDLQWINNWKKYFKSFAVDDMIIRPAWEPSDVDSEEKMVIKIDPGTSFGTGKHETTRLCIRQMKKYVEAGSKILDVGSGSGILSIIAAKLGASSITGVDIEEDAVAAARENSVTNQISPDQIRFLLGDMIASQEVRDMIGYSCYDVVIANILAVVILPLTPLVAPHLKQGGIYIISGILASQEEKIVRALDQAGNFEILDKIRENDWVSIAARKK